MEVPTQFTEMDPDFRFVPVDHESSREIVEALKASDERWETMFDDYSPEDLPAAFYRAVRVLGASFTASGNVNGYFDAVRTLHGLLPEDADIYGSDEWQAVESMYYGCQMAEDSNHVFAMIIESFTLTRRVEQQLQG